jgi:hypothetical protein
MNMTLGLTVEFVEVASGAVARETEAGIAGIGAAKHAASARDNIRRWAMNMRLTLLFMFVS